VAVSVNQTRARRLTVLTRCSRSFLYVLQHHRIYIYAILWLCDFWGWRGRVYTIAMTGRFLSFSPPFFWDTMGARSSGVFTASAKWKRPDWVGCMRCFHHVFRRRWIYRNNFWGWLAQDVERCGSIHPTMDCVSVQIRSLEALGVAGNTNIGTVLLCSACFGLEHVGWTGRY